jgi:peptidoglycan/xylan/chitin deacetylase (PgdA/CDA1 family)
MSRIFRALAHVCAGLLLVAAPLAAQSKSSMPPVYVTLWFDTEDYILPEDDDATKRLAEMLTRLGVRATFKIVGEKARVLEQRGRRDVIAALRKHEIGYHAENHSQQPTIAVYLQHAGWEDGIAEFARREGQGVKDIRRIFGVTPTCYGQPGSSWAPQSYAALKQMGIPMYLDEGSHVGIDDQPFYYGGMLNVFKMRSTVARMEFEGENNVGQAKEKFLGAYKKLSGQGGGTVSIYYHPNEWVHTEFWDGVNFARGKNPRREDWKLPGTKPAAETEKAFRDFEQYITFIKAQPGVRFVTASELMQLYADRTIDQPVSSVRLGALARAASREITFQRFDDVAYSGADTLALLTTALVLYDRRDDLPGKLTSVQLSGPTRPFVPSRAGRPESVSWDEFGDAVRDVFNYMRATRHVPNEVWFGVRSISPEDYLATLAAVIEDLNSGGKRPAVIKIRAGKLAAAQYVAEDSPRLWNWAIHPEGFHAPQIIVLARLQAWTLKPALLQK